MTRGVRRGLGRFGRGPAASKRTCCASGTPLQACAFPDCPHSRGRYLDRGTGPHRGGCGKDSEPTLGPPVRPAVGAPAEQPPGPAAPRRSPVQHRPHADAPARPSPLRCARSPAVRGRPLADEPPRRLTASPNRSPAALAARRGRRRRALLSAEVARSSRLSPCRRFAAVIAGRGCHRRALRLSPVVAARGCRRSAGPQNMRATRCRSARTARP